MEDTKNMKKEDSVPSSPSQSGSPVIISRRNSSPQTRNGNKNTLEYVEKQISTLPDNKSPIKINRKTFKAGKSVADVAVAVAVLDENKEHVGTAKKSDQSKKLYTLSPNKTPVDNSNQHYLSPDSMTPNMCSLHSSPRSSIDESARTTDNDADVESNMSEYVNENSLFSFRESSEKMEKKNMDGVGGQMTEYLTCCFFVTCIVFVVTILFIFVWIPDREATITPLYRHKDFGAKRQVLYGHYLKKFKACGNMVSFENYLFVPVNHDNKQCKLFQFNLWTGDKHVQNYLFEKPLKIVCTRQNKCILIYRNGNLKMLGENGNNHSRQYCFQINKATIISDINKDGVTDLLVNCVSENGKHSIDFLSGTNISPLKNMKLPKSMDLDDVVLHPEEHNKLLLLLTEKNGSSFLYSLNISIQASSGWKNSVQLITTANQPFSNIFYVNNNNKNDIFTVTSGSIVEIIHGFNLSVYYRMKIDSKNLLRIFPLTVNNKLFVGLLYHDNHSACPYKLTVYDPKNSSKSSTIFLQEMPHVGIVRNTTKILLWQNKQNIMCKGLVKNEIEQKLNEVYPNKKILQISNIKSGKNNQVAPPFLTQPVSEATTLYPSNDDAFKKQRRLRKREYNPMYETDNREYLQLKNKLRNTGHAVHKCKPIEQVNNSRDRMKKCTENHQDVRHEERDGKDLLDVSKYIHELQLQLFNSIEAAVFLFTSTINGPDIDQSKENVDVPNIYHSKSMNEYIQPIDYQDQMKNEQYEQIQKNVRKMRYRTIEQPRVRNFMIDKAYRHIIRSKRNVKKIVRHKNCSNFYLNQLIFDGKKISKQKIDSLKIEDCDEINETIVETLLTDTSQFITRFNVYLNDGTYIGSRIAWNKIL